MVGDDLEMMVALEIQWQVEVEMGRLRIGEVEILRDIER
jgi:hypothetical protein